MGVEHEMRQSRAEEMEAGDRTHGMKVEGDSREPAMCRDTESGEKNWEGQQVMYEDATMNVSYANLKINLK